VITASAQTKQSSTANPRTVRDFFNLLPQNYFPIISCKVQSDKNCDKARREYLKNYLIVEDTANGYMKGGCDGGQKCFVMALFRRPSSSRTSRSYIVGLNTWDEFGEETYFLEYSNGEWRDIGKEVVPEYNKERKAYELPRYGTTIEVYELKSDEIGNKRSRKLYDLIWKEGKFSIKK
jgi:hypothetical protein